MNYTRIFLILLPYHTIYMHLVLTYRSEVELTHSKVSLSGEILSGKV